MTTEQTNEQKKHDDKALELAAEVIVGARHLPGLEVSRVEVDGKPRVSARLNPGAPVETSLRWLDAGLTKLVESQRIRVIQSDAGALWRIMDSVFWCSEPLEGGGPDAVARRAEARTYDSGRDPVMTLDINDIPGHSFDHVFVAWRRRASA